MNKVNTSQLTSIKKLSFSEIFHAQLLGTNSNQPYIVIGENFGNVANFLGPLSAVQAPPSSEENNHATVLFPYILQLLHLRNEHIRVGTVVCCLTRKFIVLLVVITQEKRAIIISHDSVLFMLNTNQSVHITVQKTTFGAVVSHYLVAFLSKVTVLYSNLYLRL